MAILAIPLTASANFLSTGVGSAANGGGAPSAPCVAIQADMTASPLNGARPGCNAALVEITFP